MILKITPLRLVFVGLAAVLAGMQILRVGMCPTSQRELVVQRTSEDGASKGNKPRDENICVLTVEASARSVNSHPDLARVFENAELNADISWTPATRPFAFAAAANNAKYCSAHGYRFIFSALSWPVPVHWARILATKVALESCDYVLYLDSDVVLHDHSKSLDFLIESLRPPSKKIISIASQSSDVANNCMDVDWTCAARWCADLPEEKQSCHVNTGVYLVRRSPEATQMLRQWFLSLDQTDDRDKGRFHADNGWRLHDQVGFNLAVMPQYMKEGLVDLRNFEEMNSWGPFTTHYSGVVERYERIVAEVAAIVKKAQQPDGAGRWWNSFGWC